MTGTDCGLFTHKSVPVIFEPPCILRRARPTWGCRADHDDDLYILYFNTLYVRLMY